MLKKLIAVCSVAMTAGCSTGPAPNFYNGQWYLAGDANCVKMNGRSRTQINCFNKQGQNTGYRDAMTLDQVTAYRNMQVQQQMINQINANNQALAAQAAMMRNHTTYIPQNPNWGWNQPRQVRCLVNGILIACNQY